MSNDERDRIVGEFTAELNWAWSRAGQGSYRDAARQSRQLISGPGKPNSPMQVLVPSTTWRIMAGRRRTLPTWAMVFSLLTVLRDTAERHGVPPDTLGTLKSWKTKHEAAQAALRELGHGPRPRHDPADPAPWGPGDPAPVDEDDSLLWWRPYAAVVPDWFQRYLTLESVASLIRSYETQYIPGLLQTEAYARATMRPDRADISNDADELLDLRVELRMLRQRILVRGDGPKLWATIDEAALRRRIGDAATMRAQIRHLIELSELDNVAAIQVIPFTSSHGGHAAAGGPISLLRFREQQFSDIIYLEQPADGIYLSDPADVGHYSLVLSRLAVEAYPPTESLDFLRGMLADV
ncbi:MAG TPA: DUF5753 domain-containing protein [Streptosporangiaceae bacterium]|nr:DUF5753 domain-containing protein [Streptosporangiaceae bacterium]